METQEFLLTALRATAVYVLMLVVIRLMGKRTVGNFTAFDLLVALMLGEIVDEIIYPDREHNMEADQMQPRTGNQRGQALHEF